MSDAATRLPRFKAQSTLRTDLDQAVDAYFRDAGLDPGGGPRMWVKSVALIGWALASYLLLILWASTWWTAAPLAVSLGLALAGIGFSVMHDGNHGAYSRRRWVNRLTGATIDFMGGSSYVWRQKHNVLHHTYTNIDGVDDDIELRPFFRLTESQGRSWFHRFQHIYWVPLFAFFTTKWILLDDFVAVAKGEVGHHPMRRPRGLDLAQLLAGKLCFVVWAIVLPLQFVPLVPYLVGYALVCTVWGITMGLVFQLAHAVEGVSFMERAEVTRDPWIEHQLATTADFARSNPVLTWYLGGLNHQVEHHLFARVCHVHYPALAGVVRDVCRAHGITPHDHPTMLGALRAHLRFLKRLGAAPVAPALVAPDAAPVAAPMRPLPVA